MLGYGNGDNVIVKIDNTELSSRLAENESQQTYFMGSTVKSKNKPTKGIVTFWTDDASIQDYTVFKPLFQAQGVPFCTAVITDSVGGQYKCTKAQLLEIQSLGNEICSHTKSHLHLSELTDTECEFQLYESKKWLDTNGFQVDTVAYPYGFWGDREKAFAKKYYRAARCSDYGKNGLNQSPIETYELKTIWLDSSVVIANDPSGFTVNTFNYYKYYIDQAVQKNTWIIISSHSGDIENAGLTQILTDVVAYAKSVSEILTVSQALDRIGNIFETGNLQKVNKNKKHFVVGYDGNKSTNNVEQVYYPWNYYDGNTPIGQFEDYQVSVNKVNFVTAIATNLPEQVGGTLFTYKMAATSEDNIYNYQLYYLATGNGIYMRLCKQDKTWDSWSLVNALQVKGNIGINFNQGINKYKEGITLNHLDGANGALSPTGTAGTLLTYRVSNISTTQYNFQEFTEYAGRRKYKRYAIDSVTWSAWEEIGSRDTYPVINAVDGNTSITTMGMGVTYNTVNTTTASATGLPESVAGTLITYKIHATDNNYNYQTYHVYGTAKLYKRSFDLAGTPTAWNKISAV